MTAKQPVRSVKKAYWEKHLEKWQASGLTQQKYCQQENINLTTFTWWRSKRLKDKAQPSLTFIPALIKEKAPVPSHTDIQIVLPNQVKVILPLNLSADILVSLLKALGGLS